MKKRNTKKYLKRIIITLLLSYFVYSTFINLGYRNHINQSQERNYQHLQAISAIGDNLAHRLEEFTRIPIEQEDERNAELFDTWRVVSSESRSIYSYLSGMSTLHMEDEADDWNLLQYSLFRVDMFIDGMTNKFLENRSYQISDEEKEKMDAVISVYRNVSKEAEKESVNIERLLESIQEPMLIIDNYYSDALEKSDRNY
ncbi:MULTISPECIES: hypothetical protein [Bacillaceae]|uniref:Uncharacterized protein n=1 Tax=Cytobacillus firmus TaxID=1399 RepID=A0AA46P4R4_CYTFI|nr:MULTISPECIES: hypothetical protein [Bacillaceae]MCC3648934.1 hypothetical protein [Cytobacillus oceanisediminis]MCU1808062.1 hypothetical protein [Cytobacillus firmus]UYG97562.1 hypothetical protein OD459_11310 [Cytobacillus firmus]WHY34745.1 hypothetical protein QNH44_03010 [Cytobacillus firmus]